MKRKKCGSLGIFIEKDPFAWSEQVPVGDLVCRADACISSTRSGVYHQYKVLHIIKPKRTLCTAKP